jgi:hypothetical protein
LAGEEVSRFSDALLLFFTAVDVNHSSVYPYNGRSGSRAQSHLPDCIESTQQHVIASFATAAKMATALTADNETPLFLLNPPIPAKEYREQLWGSLILNPFKPIDSYSSCDSKSPTEMVSKIKTNPQPINNYGEIIQWSERGGAEATVERVFKAYFGTSQAAVEFRNSTSASWYYMGAQKKRLGELCKNEEWKKDVLQFQKDNPGEELFFVTAALVVKKLETGRAQGHAKQGGAGITVPNPQDGSKVVSIGADASKDGQRAVVATFAQPQIIALGYHSVKITEEVAEQQKHSISSKLRRLLGLKEKNVSHLVGTLHDIEAKKYYRLNMTTSMHPGNVKFLDDESDDGKVEEASIDQLSSVGSEVAVPGVEKGAEDAQGTLNGNIAIYSPDRSKLHGNSLE